MPGRIQSPSSINTYRQCPRKYYYQYIEELPTKPSIHLVRGHVVHEVLENFFHLDTSDLSRANYEMALKKRIQDLLLKHWQEEKDFSKLDLTKEKLMFYFDESMLMLLNWINQFIARLEAMMVQGFGLADAFRRLTPTTEQQYVSEEHKVQGFIDAIEDIDDHVRIIDYKTSKSFDISEEYKLQLAIYALLYNEKHGKLPNKVGINFLKDVEKFLDVDEDLVRYAKKEIDLVHKKTATDDISAYPLVPQPLCKWCDFFNKCFGVEGEKYPFNNNSRRRM
ncbi:PD-(D/E)XK nuclease family protein [Candidatus Woesearchaeota archaeon]|nr:PD-(D/E)XK nuclease family protein [Candidatus Woesearchaeota archaeon]